MTYTLAGMPYTHYVRAQYGYQLKEQFCAPKGNEPIKRRSADRVWPAGGISVNLLLASAHQMGDIVVLDRWAVGDWSRARPRGLHLPPAQVLTDDSI